MLRTRATHRQAGGSLFAGVLIALFAAGSALASPPMSGAVSRFDYYAGPAYLDEADGLIALAGAPFPDGCFGTGFDDPFAVTEVATPAGPLVWLARQGPTPVAVFDMAAGHPCAIVAGGGSIHPLYTGTITTVLTDNDREVSGSRMNAYGFSSHGVVWNADDDRCQFAAHARFQFTPAGEDLVLSEDIAIAC